MCKIAALWSSCACASQQFPRPTLCMCKTEAPLSYIVHVQDSSSLVLCAYARQQPPRPAHVLGSNPRPIMRMCKTAAVVIYCACARHQIPSPHLYSACARQQLPCPAHVQDSSSLVLRMCKTADPLSCACARQQLPRPAHVQDSSSLVLRMCKTAALVVP